MIRRDAAVQVLLDPDVLADGQALRAVEWRQARQLRQQLVDADLLPDTGTLRHRTVTTDLPAAVLPRTWWQRLLRRPPTVLARPVLLVTSMSGTMPEPSSPVDRLERLGRHPLHTAPWVPEQDGWQDRPAARDEP